MLEVSFIVDFLEAVDELVFFRPNGNNEFATDLELIEERLRHLWSPRSDVNRVIRCQICIALPAVTTDETDLACLELLRVRLL